MGRRALLYRRTECIGVDGDQKAIALRPRPGEILDMPGVHDVEAATGEPDPVAGGSRGGDPFIDGIVREQLGAWIQFGWMGHARSKDHDNS